MPHKYTCTCCHFFTDLKGDYARHLLTKKHQKNTNSQPNSQHFYGISQIDVDNIHMDAASSDLKNEFGLYVCNFCEKGFKYKQSKYRHMKKSCKFKDINAKLKPELDEILSDKTNKEKDIIIKSLFQEIDKLKEQLKTNTSNNVYNGNIISGNNFNIQLLNYNKTNYEFLEDKDYIRCIQQNNHCVKALIEKVHFNKNHPENMNIYIKSIKGNYLLVYRNNNWDIVDRKQQIDYLYDTNEVMLENWYDECKHKYPDIIKSFNRYLKNKQDDDELVSNVKKEILMMLYNKRSLCEVNDISG